MLTWTLILILKGHYPDGGIAVTEVKGFQNKQTCQKAFAELIVPKDGDKSGLCVEVNR